MISCDVCVVGAGPAGAIIAKRLQQFGYSVVIVEKEPYPRSSIGLSLSPGIHHWLNLLEVDRQVNEAGFERAHSSLVLWESDTPITRMLNGSSAGYHVNRAQFDEILIQSAVSRGVRLLRPFTIGEIKLECNGRWNLSLKGSSLDCIQTKFLVEATGRKPFLRGRKEAYLPSTLATFSYWKINKAKNALSIIEAGKNHWYWGAPVDNNKYLACVFSNPESIKKADSIQAYYLSRIKDSTLFPNVLKGAQNLNVSVCSATPYQDLEVISYNHIKIGDSALSTDPISSQGVQKAIKSAVQGAIVVNTILSPNGNSIMAIDYYEKKIATEAVKSARWSKHFYNLQKRYQHTVFWDERKDLLIPNQKVPIEHTISIAPSDRLTINPKAVILNVSIVEEALIESAKGVFLEGNDEPFVFYDGKLVVDILAKIDGNQAKYAMPLIRTQIPDASPRETLKWLLYHELLVSVK